MRVAQNSTQIELHVPDFQTVKEFYGMLGFQVVWERKPEGKKGYLVIKKDNNILCFWSGNEYIKKQSYFRNFPFKTKRGYGVEIIIMEKDIENLYEKAKSFCKIVNELKAKPWGLKDFRIEDPFGFYIRISEPHNVLDEEANAIA